MDHTNQVMADLIRDDLNSMDKVHTIVVHAYGPEEMRFKKTFSETMPQDFTIARKHLRGMLEEMENSWSE